MEVNAYVLRAVLARMDLDDEGATQVGTSIKEHLGNATTVEEALRHMAQFDRDLNGFNKYVPFLLAHAKEPAQYIGGAGITISEQGGDGGHRVDAKGTIGTDYVWLDPVDPAFPGNPFDDSVSIRPTLDMTNQWLLRLRPDTKPWQQPLRHIFISDPLPPITVAAGYTIDHIGRTFTITFDQDSGIPFFSQFPGGGFFGPPTTWWTNINWPGGAEPGFTGSNYPPGVIGGKTTYAFIKVGPSEYDGFVIGSKIPYP